MTSGEGDEQGSGRESIRVVPEGLPGRPQEVTFGIGGQLPEAGTVPSYQEHPTSLYLRPSLATRARSV